MRTTSSSLGLAVATLGARGYSLSNSVTGASAVLSAGTTLVAKLAETKMQNAKASDTKSIPESPYSR